ncbi:phototropic-responsive NPH3 family protein isoform X2 [Tasmannia lanceolata]|uniref:phototropic-responsive NPH3 family protein isoform X2 n=1 Tax=Tasmannia lanceolata TaxID=3420 RepID=UPI004062A73D
MARQNKPLFPSSPTHTEKSKTMAINDSRESWFSASGSLPILLHAYGKTFHLNQKHLISRSAKLALILREKKKNHQDLSCCFTDIPVDVETFELAVKFCEGYEPELSSENVVSLACIAYYLEMTEEHSPNNLLRKTLSFFKKRILPNWNESIKAIRTCEPVLQQAIQLGLIDACLNSITAKALSDPNLLGKPIHNPANQDETSLHRPSTRRKLFEVDWWFEDLTTLTLPLFELVMSAMIQQGVPPEYIAGCLFRYAKNKAVQEVKIDRYVYHRSPHKEVIEAVERLLPDKKGILHCKFLFEMLRWAIGTQASASCRNGFEIRIGKQLNEAVVEDLRIPSYGYSCETRYDIDCVIRMLKIFYANYTSPDPYGVIGVLELVDEYLAEVGKETNLKRETFMALTEMAAGTSSVVGRCTDGIYHAIDVYLDSHKHLTEFEREEICQVLDCEKMSRAASVHAAQNERLPLRVVVQVLFVGHLRLREDIAGVLPDSDRGSREEEEKVVEGEEDEMKRLDCRVMELERECCEMKREIQRGSGNVGVRGRKESVWKGMKRKFGCKSSFHDSICHVKVYPKHGV